MFRYFFLFSIVGPFVHAAEVFEHRLDTTSLQNLYEVTRCKSDSAVATENRVLFEYWELANRIDSQKIHDTIFTTAEKKCFNEHAEAVFNSDTYTMAFKRAKKDPETWGQYKKISAIVSKNKLVSRNVQFPEKCSDMFSLEFIEINRNISKEACPWLIAGVMFRYYLQQIERNHTVNLHK